MEGEKGRGGGEIEGGGKGELKGGRGSGGTLSKM